VSFPLYFDEDASVIIATRLTHAHFDVLTARDAGRSGRGVPDEDQLEFAASLGRALVSLNARDYAPLFDRWWQAGRHHAGIILITPQRNPDVMYRRLVRLQDLYRDGIDDLLLYA
jgi:hypothetical protein